MRCMLDSQTATRFARVLPTSLCVMNLIEEIRKSWGWIGIDPVEVVGENDFGNLIVKSSDGKYWRLTPEDCTLNIVANNRAELDELSKNQKFLHDWYMMALVSAAT